MSNGSDIAAEIKAGLIEAGQQTGNDEQLNFVISRDENLETPWSTGTPTPDRFDITGVISKRTERDGAGMVLRTVRTALLDATGRSPTKGDLIAIGVTVEQVTIDTKWIRVGEVNTTSPGGVPLLHKVTLDD